jgi:nucleotide-binding universal stress UspA family protein
MNEIRNILAGTDLSPASDRVLRTAAVLAGQSGARLYVLHAVEPLAAMPIPTFGGAGAGMESLVVQQEWLNARGALDAQLTRVFGQGHPHVTVFVEGEAAPRALCTRAERLGADLIVIGPHADGEGGPRLLGTTAENVLRSAGVPVLVVRDIVATSFARLLVTSDPAETCAGIVDAALSWAAAFGAGAEEGVHARVDVVHVIPEVVSGKMPFRQATVEPADHPEIREVAARWPGVDVQARLLFGEGVVDTLLEYARDTHPDLLVAGSHGRGAVARAFLGSTSSAMARQAPCSVLLVPPSLWIDREAGTVPGSAGAG